MSFEVHREPLYRRYYASAFSGACLYAVVFGFFLVVLPLIIAYNSAYFWLKEDIAYRQPKVSYQYQTLLQLHGDRSGNAMDLFYSTSPAINRLYSTTLRVPVLQSAEQDDNRDGRTDRIELNILMPLAPTESVHSFTCVVYYEVEFDSPVKYIFDAAAYANYESKSGIVQLRMDGDLLLRQTWPLVIRGGFREPYNDDELIDLEVDTSAYEVSIGQIMEKNNARNLTLVYDTRFAYVERRASSTPADVSNVPYFNATVIMRVPFQPVRYTPTVAMVLKNAWIQYVSFFIVVAFLLFRLNSFVFGHKLLHTYSSADIVYEKMD